MIDYNALYEYVRKEKYGEQLQVLPKAFLSEVAEFLKTSKKSLLETGDGFNEEGFMLKKQFENSLSLYKELMRIRKKKILQLAFVASETGIMKRDFSTLLDIEQELFEQVVASVENAQKRMNDSLTGNAEVKRDNFMVIITQPLNEFVDMSGKLIGPFDKGMLVNLDASVAQILVSEGKATLVD